MSRAALMFQGTGSDVGKSLIVAGLCRALVGRGLAVRPFKPQNMSNNAAVTAEGGEIGRAQALQARACRVAPSVDMNPVLLKPQTDMGSQVVVQGEMQGTVKARDYYRMKPSLMPRVMESYQRLRKQADVVLVEGAGSAAEINLRAGDIANMGFALEARVPVFLIGDIDRGGVIASLVGTHALLSQPENDLVAGYLINRFRGDPALFDSGLEAIGKRTGWPDFGVIPFFDRAGELPAEDSMGLESKAAQGGAHGTTPGRIRVVVPVLSRIQNFDDLDPLIAEPDVELTFVKRGNALPGDADLVVLPGSKSTIGDLRDLREQGWHIDLEAHLRRGGWVIGLCGGYQMLGRSVEDADGIEGPPGKVDGLGWLDVHTRLEPRKALRSLHGRDCRFGAAVHGYEMHLGVTEGPDASRPLLELDGRPEGASSLDGKVLGTYLHGLFAADGFRHAFLNAVKTRARSGLAFDAQVESALDALADHLEANVDIDSLLAAAARPHTSSHTTTQTTSIRVPAS